MEEEKVQETVDIKPLKKGRRILVFLADFFIHFMITFVFFNIAVAPIGKAITNYNQKNEQHIQVTREMYHHYYASKILLCDSSFEEYDATAGIEYTYRCFLSYYVLDSEESIDSSHPQYGHKKENETINHYYVDIRNDIDSYVTHFKSYNEKNNYFSFNENEKAFYLKNEVKNELYSFYDPKDEMGTIGQTYYNNIQKYVFNPLMARVMSDIETYDLNYEGQTHSYIECRKIIKSIETYHHNLMTACAYISHFISWSACFLIFPLVHPRRKTPALMFMRIEKVDFYSLNHPKRSMQLICSVYSLFSTMLGIMFIPSLLVPFNTLFSLRFLIYGTVFSLALILADLIFLLVNQYNRSLIDYLSNNLYLTEEEMDEIYRAKGYTL